MSKKSIYYSYNVRRWAGPSLLTLQRRGQIRQRAKHLTSTSAATLIQ